MEYVKDFQVLKAKNIEISVTAKSTLQEIGKAERMNQTTKNMIPTILFSSGTPANL